MKRSIKVDQFNNAKTLFPFISRIAELSDLPELDCLIPNNYSCKLELKKICPLEVIITDWNEFISKVPFNMDDFRTGSTGWIRSNLYAIDDKNYVSSVSIKNGVVVLYPAGNMIASGYGENIPDDDILIPGESIGDAVARYENQFVYLVLKCRSNDAKNIAEISKPGWIL
ncbi:hypothetical protein ACFL6I_26620 [candidate division KSB1 bacterium]